MTDPALRDPERNVAYYSACEKYADNKARFDEPRVKWIAARLPQKGRVLDIGAADGFLAELLAEGVEYMGVELNAQAIASAYPRARGRILRANAATWALAAADLGTFDGVLCCEVLEHVPDPAGLLIRLRSLLSPRGVLISTSALGSGHGHEPGNTEHLVEWNPAEYYRLHMQAGFMIVEQATVRVYDERFTNTILATPAPGGGA